MTDRQTLDVYDARATEYADLTTDGVPDTQLRHFLDLLPDASDVLDLGCGPGRSAMMIAAEGHRVTATDASAQMVDLAKAHPGVTARMETFHDLTGTALYHGIWANFSLLHAERADLPRHFAAIRDALKPNGIFHIGMKTGAKTRRDTIGRRYTYVTREELLGWLDAAGMTPLQEWTGTSRGLDGEMAPWIVIQARKHD
ncbi:class I SAM-dependent methyltransferase [Aliishimia ponticola]|uniref:Class I SAM-dependent methyltransferase n=1 Tax=Aliishimia ponticola TaxID=2499833 RepID=A0A4S4N7D8_9RHOB|nr:class I SAM-dependent methyltransferase [Aliishimia ponticola]THH35062.1 class I SAM-dependent methyltransferase [Aliishimia ponticola]